ncbi:MAG: CBS domain-containing protein [Anaerolineales bacterium]|nr:CBS domain-containing protein [Anaerolineales bacterium]
MAKLVRDLMRPEVITCKPEITLGRLAGLLAEHHVHALFVTGAEDKIVGVITDFDLLAGEWLSGNGESLETMRAMTAGDLMSTPVDTIDAGASAREAAQMMQDLTVRRLLVVEGGKPVGVISVSDVVAYIAEGAVIQRNMVADVMSDAFLACRDKTPLASAARAMTTAGWRSVLVVDALGKPLGVVSGLDLLPFCDFERDCAEMTVVEVMHPALTIEMHASLQEAAHKMIENHYHRLVVTDPEQPDAVPLGIISSFDIVAEMARPGSVWQM